MIIIVSHQGFSSTNSMRGLARRGVMLGILWSVPVVVIRINFKNKLSSVAVRIIVMIMTLKRVIFVYTYYYVSNNTHCTCG